MPVFYCSRAIEWIHLRQIIREVLSHFGLSEQVDLDSVAFSWSYDRNLATKIYKPSEVFKKFSFILLLDPEALCACHTAKRFQSFLDPLTANEWSGPVKSSPHVRSMDLRIIQNPKLRAALQQGLNHIPLAPTDLNQALLVAVDAFERLYDLLRLQEYGLELQDASSFFRQLCYDRLCRGSKANRFGLRFSGPALFSIPAVKNELNWLLSHLYISGLDKASNNPCFMCIQHIRLQAFHRLSSDDFAPCMDGSRWSLPTAVFDSVNGDIMRILPEAPPAYNSLPFLMATYKQHKQKYRWLTNAFRTVYSNIATLITLATMAVLDHFRVWAKKTVTGYNRFLKIDTSILWMVDSILHVTLNLPCEMHDIYVADVTKCFESIPLSGNDNLLDAVRFFLKIGFHEAALLHPKADTILWVKINSDGTPCSTCWNTTCPRSGYWIPLDLDRLLSLHEWLMNNCFVTLGDRVWRQIKGIPMGFSCSPLWCNIYLIKYEVQFIQRLAKLGRPDLMSKFKFAFRYIDDICWFNVGNPYDFLDPSQPRSPENPYWIYPLHLLEIKTEIEHFAPDDPSRGISAHFMNLHIHINVNEPAYFVLQKYDKRRSLPFQYTQFIKFHSNRPIRNAYNIILSQVLPILYLSNDNRSAVQEILCLVRTLVNNGFQADQLMQKVSVWLQGGQFPATKVHVPTIIHLLGKNSFLSPFLRGFTISAPFHIMTPYSAQSFLETALTLSSSGFFQAERVTRCRTFKYRQFCK